MYSYEEWETFLQREEESIETKLINIAINEKIAVDLLSDYSQTHKEYLSGECKKYDLHTMFQTTRRCLNKLTDVNSKNLYQCQGTITA
ncbi:hypothetical protein [Candidiatus Paracoxiella cheracis]|uniref:hypothetical protein n=1 Tax=Candidiatus Paracoxiella cheracis TaxID=3405120 RepID=UPI003BF53798